MGCKCKEKAKFFKENLSDEALGGVIDIDGSDGGGFFGILKKIPLYIMQFILGIVVGIILIIVVIPVVFYISFCIMFGMEPIINIGKIINLFKKE